MPGARSADRTARLKSGGFLICSDSMRNPRRNAEGAYSRALWHQRRGRSSGVPGARHGVCRKGARVRCWPDPGETLATAMPDVATARPVRQSRRGSPGQPGSECPGAGKVVPFVLAGGWGRAIDPGTPQPNGEAGACSARPGLLAAARAFRGRAFATREPVTATLERRLPEQPAQNQPRAGRSPRASRHGWAEAGAIIVCIANSNDDKIGADCPLCARQEAAAAGARAAVTVALSLTQPKMPPWAVIMRRATAWNSGK